MRILIFMAALCAGVGPRFAAADVIHFQQSIPMATTDWTAPVSLSQFDPTLGTLQSVALQLHVFIQGTAFYENRETSPTVVSLTLSSSMELLDSSSSVVLSANPSANVMESASAFDGTLDFNGPSGSTIAGLNDDEIQSVSYPPPLGALPAFIGFGTVDYTVSAVGTSTGTGPGNWAFGFILQAAADVDITYTYLPIPEPAALSCFAAGALLRRRRFRNR